MLNGIAIGAILTGQEVPQGSGVIGGIPATQRGKCLEIAPPAGVNASGSVAGSKGAAMFGKAEGEAKAFAFDKVRGGLCGAG